MACKVSISAEVLETETDKGVIVGAKYVARTQVAKDELIRVSAKMTDTCKAKIRIQDRPITGPFANVVAKHTPGTPDGETCTKYKEITYWVTEVKRGGGNDPSIEFTATADCAACGCEDETREATASCSLKVTGGS